MQDSSAKVSLAYPAKLIVDGVIMKDLFPEWDDIIYGSRIDIRHTSQESYAHKNVQFIPSGHVTSQLTSIHVASGSQGSANHESGSPREMETDAAFMGRGNRQDSSFQGHSESVISENGNMHREGDVCSMGTCGTSSDFKTPNAVNGRKHSSQHGSGTGSRPQSRSRSRSRTRSLSHSRSKSAETENGQ